MILINIRGGVDSHPYKKIRCGIGRSEKGGDFNKALGKYERHKFKVSENE